MRAYIHKRKEFYYAPEGEEHESLSEFWAVVRGYREKGLKVTVDRPAEVKDMNDKDLYERDFVQCVYYYQNGTHETRNGIVKFKNGSFIARGSLGWYDHLYKDPMAPYGFKYKVKKIGNYYEDKIVGV